LIKRYSQNILKFIKIDFLSFEEIKQKRSTKRIMTSQIAKIPRLPREMMEEILLNIDVDTYMTIYNDVKDLSYIINDPVFLDKWLQREGDDLKYLFKQMRCCDLSPFVIYRLIKPKNMLLVRHHSRLNDKVADIFENKVFLTKWYRLNRKAIRASLADEACRMIKEIMFSDNMYFLERKTAEIINKDKLESFLSIFRDYYIQTPRGRVFKEYFGDFFNNLDKDDPGFEAFKEMVKDFRVLNQKSRDSEYIELLHFLLATEWLYLENAIYHLTGRAGEDACATIFKHGRFRFVFENVSTEASNH